MAGSGGNGREEEKGGEEESLIKQPLLAPEAVLASRSKPSASSDEQEYQGYGYPESDDVSISIDNSLLSDQVKLSGYVDGSVRKCKDIPFAVAFLTLLAATLVGGFVAMNTGDHEFHRYHDDYVHRQSFINDQGFCSVKKPALGYGVQDGNSSVSVFKSSFDPLMLPIQFHGYKGERRHPEGDAGGAPDAGAAFGGFCILFLLLLVCILSAVGIGTFFVWLLKTYTDQITRHIMPGFLVTWGVVSIGFAMTLEHSTFFFGLLIGSAFVCWLWLLVLVRKGRNSNVELSIKILKVALQSVHENWGLLGVMMQVLGVAMLIATFVTYLISSTFEHHSILVPNPDAVPGSPCGGDDALPCCVRVLEDWTKFYVGIAAVFCIWCVFLLDHVNAFAISGTVGQWYFAPSGSNSVLFTKAALQTGLGKSFGTICCSSLISTLIALVRALASRLPMQDECQSVMAIFTRCCLSFIEEAVSFFTRFTISFAAITGESFFKSAKLTYNLLKRNCLSTIIVDTYCNVILNIYLLICWILFSMVVVAIVALNNLALQKSSNAQPDSVQLLIIFIDATLVLLSLAVLYVLCWYNSVVCHAVDTIYICYALDKEVGKMSKEDVHEVYVLLPTTEPDEANVAVGLSRR